MDLIFLEGLHRAGAGDGLAKGKGLTARGEAVLRGKRSSRGFSDCKQKAPRFQGNDVLALTCLTTL